MNCAGIRQDDLIERYLCDQLDESASDLLETHMLGCPDCSRLLEDLQSLRSELEERAAIIRAAAPKQKRFLFWLPAVASASAVVLDREIEFVDGLIQENRKAEKVFVTFTCALLLAGLGSFVWLLIRSAFDKILLGAAGGIAWLFSALPICLFFSVRGNTIYLNFLRSSWQDALAEHNSVVLQKLNDELTEFRKAALSKPFWSIK